MEKWGGEGERNEKTLLTQNARRACDPREFVKCIIQYIIIRLYMHYLRPPKVRFAPPNTRSLVSTPVIILYELWHEWKNDDFFFFFIKNITTDETISCDILMCYSKQLAPTYKF